LRWVLPHGALGVATGAIVIGTVATSTSTTTIISIRTIISTAMSTARGKVTGNTIRNIVEMRLTVTGEQRISLVATTGSNPAAVTALALETARAAELALEIALVTELGLEIVREAALALGIAPVAALELEHGLVAEELGLVPGAAVPEHGPVGAVLARGRPHDRLAVPLRIKSVTALHHHGLAPVPAVEDLAAVVETTREPAAPEVVIAWAAAG